MIESVALQDENGIVSEIFVSGHPFKIVVRLVGQECVENLTLGILIRDKFGQDMYGTNTHHLNQEMEVRQNEAFFVTWGFEQFNLGPGKYSVTVAVHTGSTHIDECFHWVDKGAEFEVVSGEGPVFTGLLRLEPKLS
jgi:lipopolysaccharide transport system ATP-binding protein